MVSLEEYAERHPRLTDVVIVLALLGGAVLGANLDRSGRESSAGRLGRRGGDRARLPGAARRHASTRGSRSW